MCGEEDGMVCTVGHVSQQGQPRQQMEGYSRPTREIRISLRHYHSNYSHKNHERNTSMRQMAIML